MGFSRLLRFDRTLAIWIWFNGESNGSLSIERKPGERAPLGSLDTLPRLRSPSQTDGGNSIKAFESRKSHGKIGDCEQSSQSQQT